MLGIEGDVSTVAPCGGVARDLYTGDVVRYLRSARCRGRGDISVRLLQGERAQQCQSIFAIVGGRWVRGGLGVGEQAVRELSTPGLLRK